MKSLKESILADMDDTLNQGDKIIDKVLRNKLIDIIHNSNQIYPKIDNKTYQDIIDTFTEVPSTDKKGTKWEQVIPDVLAGANFKPFMINAKKGIYRKANEKELYGTTTSAMNKRLKKDIDIYKKYNINTGYYISGYNYKKYFMCEYTYVELPSSMNSDWYTFGYYTYNPKKIEFISCNYNTKEWTYKPNNSIPTNIVNNYTLAQVFLNIGNLIVSNLKRELQRCFKSQYNEIKHLIDIKVLKVGDIYDLKKNPKDWIKINVETFVSGKYVVDSYFYINMKRFEILTKEYLDYFDLNTTNTKNININDIKTEIKAIQNYRYNQASISKELDEYIKNNYKKIDRNNYTSNERWFKVHKAGNDAKYGSYMVCFDTKEWSQKTFDDFYGGGIVD